MKEKLTKFLKSKSFYVVVSILLAVTAWLLVVNTNNPVEFRTLEIPITPVNQKTLQQNDLVDISTTSRPTSVTVKIKGNAKLLETLQPNDFYVEADFKEVAEPGNFTIKIKEPTHEMLGVSVETYYPREFNCAYDKRVERYMDVTVNWDDTLTKENITILNAVTEPANILLTGFSMILDAIDKVEVNLSDSYKPGSITFGDTTSLVCRFLNAAGEDISYLFDTEKVTVRFTTGKIVPVKYSITGTPAADTYVASSSVSPDTVILTGDKTALENIKEINLGSISIQGASSSFDRNIQISSILPAGITAHELDAIRVSVNIQPYVTKTLALDPVKLTKTGEAAAYQYQYTLLQREVTVQGRATDINALQDDSIRYSVDVSGLAVGTHTLSVRFTGPERLNLIGTVQCRVDVLPGASPAPPTAAPTEEPPKPTGLPNSPEPTESESPMP